MVDRKWRKKLEEAIRGTAKVRVGFGPIFSGENDLHVRKWRIDPIVNSINEISDRYCAGIFLTPESMRNFDVIVIVRQAEGLDIRKIAELRSLGKKFVFDIVDKPYLGESRIEREETSEVVRLMDGLIASSPLHIGDFKEFDKKTVLIEHPIINTRKKDYAKSDDREIRIIWQGFLENHAEMHVLHPVIKSLEGELGKKIRIIYHTNALPKRSGPVEYKTWTIRNWEKVLTECDIAVEIKSPDDPRLQRKPSTKVLAYMASGLPVVCAPSQADRLVIEDGKTGFFAYTAEDWRVLLKKLIEDPALRKTVGEAGQEYALKNFNIKAVSEKYIDLFDKLTEERKR